MGNKKRRTFLASCFLPLKGDTKAFWSRINRYLKRQNIDLVLLTSDYADCDFLTINIPFFLEGYRTLSHQKSTLAETQLPKYILNIASRDFLWNQDQNASYGKTLSGFFACNELLSSIIHKTKPAMMLIWGSSLPQSVIMKNIADLNGIPSYVIERGLLPDTLMLESKGHGGHSDLNNQFILHNYPWSEIKPDKYSKIKQFYLNHNKPKYDQNKRLKPTELTHKLQVKTENILTFFGDYDIAAGHHPRYESTSIINSPIYKSTDHALQNLNRVVENRDDLTLLFKPHPNDHRDYDKYEDKKVKILRNINIHDLMNISDIIGVLTSTVQFEALFYEKPILLMANSQLINKGIAYECRNSDDLANQLELALQKVDFTEKTTHAKKFISFLMDSFLVRINDNIPGRIGLKEFTDFLEDRALPANSINLIYNTKINALDSSNFNPILEPKVYEESFGK